MLEVAWQSPSMSRWGGLDKDQSAHMTRHRVHRMDIHPWAKPGRSLYGAQGETSWDGFVAGEKLLAVHRIGSGGGNKALNNMAFPCTVLEVRKDEQTLLVDWQTGVRGTQPQNKQIDFCQVLLQVRMILLVLLLQLPLLLLLLLLLLVLTSLLPGRGTHAGALAAQEEPALRRLCAARRCEHGLGARGALQPGVARGLEAAAG